MKKYFTKFLPVEGEIKEGDFFSFVPIERQPLSGGIFQAHLVEDGWIEEWGIDRKFKQSACQKVKLFLCSRDIQIGDNTNVGIITHIYDTKVGVQAEQNKDYRILLTPKKDCYKVIGEISSAALSYVKEGQDFNEEQINVLLKHDTEPVPLIDVLPHHISYVLIKGPCGHFH
jgi:hypothetical protein